MDRFMQLLDMPVVDSKSGEKIATVIDVAIKDDTRDIVAILVATGGMLPAVRLVYLRDMERLDETGVYVPGGAVMKNADIEQLEKDMVRFERDMVGKKVVGQNGEEYGILKDVVFGSEINEMLELLVAGERREKRIALRDGIRVLDGGVCL